MYQLTTLPPGGKEIVQKIGIIEVQLKQIDVILSAGSIERGSIMISGKTDGHHFHSILLFNKDVPFQKDLIQFACTRYKEDLQTQLYTLIRKLAIITGEDPDA